MGVETSSPVGTIEAFRSDVIFIFLFKFLFTLKGLSLNMKKMMLCKSAEIFFAFSRIHVQSIFHSVIKALESSVDDLFV